MALAAERAWTGFFAPCTMTSMSLVAPSPSMTIFLASCWHVPHALPEGGSSSAASRRPSVGHEHRDVVGAWSRPRLSR
jgi:hypothetical protein